MRYSADCMLCLFLHLLGKYVKNNANANLNNVFAKKKACSARSILLNLKLLFLAAFQGLFVDCFIIDLIGVVLPLTIRIPFVSTDTQGKVVACRI